MVNIAAPDKSPVDESIVISIKDLQPKQRVTIRMDAVRHDVTMSSFANYEASPNGDVDLTRDKSLGGTYFGKEPMGLFWSMELTSENKRAIKMLNGRLESWPCLIRVFDGHANAFDELRDKKPLAERSVERIFLSEGVRREQVHFQTLRGLFFLPNLDTKPGPYPAVIDIYGSWQIVAHRAALLARHGYATLAVAYGGYDDLPSKVDCMDMGYFAQAVDFLKSRPEVDDDRIGALGHCLGGILSLALAREVGSAIKVVAAVSPEPIAEEWDYKFPSTGEYIKAAKFVTESYTGEDGSIYKRFKQTGGVIQGAGSIEAWRQFSVNFGRIKDAPVLLFFGAGDKFFDLDFTIPKIREQFDDEEKENYEIVFYKGAGHIIQPRFLPLFNCYYSPLFEGMLWYGGEMPDHARAQDDMWSRVLAFFQSHLKDARLDDYKTGPRPVNIRRSGCDGKLADSSDLNCQFRVVDFSE